MFKTLLGLFLIVSNIQCAQKPKKKQMSLEAAIASPQRSTDNIQRDKYRNPVETLKFFDVKPEMTVVEISPGAGWYTEILAPYLSGKLYLAAFSDDSEREYFRNTNKKLKTKVENNKELYGDIEYTVLEVPNKIGPIAPSESVDRVLTFRNIHNWMKAGKAKEVFKEFHRVLKTIKPVLFLNAVLPTTTASTQIPNRRNVAFFEPLDLELPFGVVGQVQGLGGKGEIDTLCRKSPGDLQAGALDPFLEIPVLRRVVPGENQDVQAPVIEPVEVDPWREIRVHALVIGNDLPDDGHGPFDLLRRCVVGNADVVQPADVGPLADILQP